MVRQFFLAVALSIWGLTASAQTTEISAPLTGNWNNVVTGTHPGADNCCSGGPQPLYDPATDTIHFSYQLTAVHRVIAINQALSGSGIQINGYNWGYDLRNMNGVRGVQNGTDSIVVSTFMTNSSNQFLVQDDRHYNTQFDWTRFSGTVGLPNSLSLADAGSLGIQFVSRDDGFWSGYYGPQVRNVEMTVNYTAAPVDPCVSDPQSSPSCAGHRTYYNIPDDGHAIVPIPFGFPFYDKVFTHSIFFDNGTVSFYTPNQEPQRWGAGNTSGSINGNVGSQFYYSIMPLWTDLINYNGSHYTQGDANYLRYTWDNVSQYGNPSSSNTFSLEIHPTGFVGVQYDQIDVPWATVGMIGNAALGEFATSNSQTSWSVNETVATDCSNPLNNANCPGYQQAYFDQQCSANPLYSPSCPGYAAAYFAQQCSINALSDPACPGYATAYYDYQCSVSALYHTGCPGYATAYFDQQCGLDPLYNNQCPGYATAYFDQQCGLDPLYDQKCTGYDDAYYVQQCTASPLYDSGCDGYDAAYLSQQCSIDTLYNESCPGYAVAYFDQQCSLDTLYDSACPGYAVAYFDQQCANDALYNNQCAGYSEAYAKKFILVAAPTTETTIVAEPETVTVAQATVTETKEATAAAVATETAAAVTVSASPAVAATAPASLAAAPAPATAAPAEKKAEVKTEAKTEAAAASSSAGESKSRPKTTRQALAQRRLEAAREAAAESAQNNPGAVSEQMDSAASMEQQVELQNVVLGAMGFVTGFDAYGRVTLPDAAGYVPFEIYQGQANVDTPAARGLLGRSDRIHQDMVDSQYNK